MLRNLPVFPASVTFSKETMEGFPKVSAVKGSTLPVHHGVDCTGMNIGNWTILGPKTCELRPGGRNYRTKWLCQCSCGSTPLWVTKGNIIHGKSKGCLNCYGTRNSGSDNGNWKGYGEVPGEAFNKVRNGAKERNISLEVTPADMHALWVAQDRKCALTGLLLVMGDTASLDRIDSKKPYTVDNIQWVHKVVNIMKNDFTEDVFIAMCACVATHKVAKETSIEVLKSSLTQLT